MNSVKAEVHNLCRICGLPKEKHFQEYPSCYECWYLHGRLKKLREEIKTAKTNIQYFRQRLRGRLENKEKTDGSV